MPTIQVRNLPQPIYDQLKHRAEKERRSIAQQVVVLLEKALSADPDPRERRKEAMRHMMDMKIKLSKPFDIVQAIREDRDA